MYPVPPVLRMADRRTVPVTRSVERPVGRHGGAGHVIRILRALALCLALSVGWFISESCMASDSNERVIVLIGASYAQGWNIGSIGGVPVINRGVGGQESHELLARFPHDVLAASPGQVIIWGFINDIFRSDADQVQARLTRSREDIGRMVDMARSARIQAVLVTEITMARRPGLVNVLRGWLGRLRGREAYGERVNRHVMDMNRWIRAYAEEHGVSVLDFEAVLAGPDGWRRQAYATEDGSHVTAAGYEALSDYVREAWPGQVDVRR